MKDEKEVEAISDFYKLQIKEINSFAKENLPFTEVETQLHAVRRKLRWLSIYPRALQGLIQLAETVSPGPDQTKYLVPAVVNSPFNKMPERGVNKYFLMLDKNSFLALSWMIDNLGKLKDEGLRIIAISEALQQTKGLDHFTALSETMLLLGNQPDSATVLSQGSSTCETFFKEQHLEKLVAGIKHEEQ